MVFLSLVWLNPMNGDAWAQSQTPVVTAESFVSVDKIHPGETAKIAVRLTIDETYHINARVPAEEFMIPTKLDMATHPDFTLGEVSYPKPTLRKVTFSEKELPVYEGTATLFLSVAAATTLKPGKYVLTGKLTYQACTDEACLPPKKLALEIPLVVTAAGNPANPTHPEIFSEKETGH
ncbi:MAG: protein-disulfide reductase DsbD N-terminal domain-containing protein [Blastocatellia bacterium]|nr:protein-disulfide reductase DsbD N-terminal domain-containing protein [Blastocatellia bacterium]